MSGFVHLHLHSEYSLLDGAARVDKIPEAVLALGQNAVAITDHGALFGAVDFYRACKKHGVKPIIGCEVYLSPKSRFSNDKEYSHLVLLCKNEEGYKNLIYLVSHGYTEGFYYKPRIDMELLREHSSGLVCLSGCVSGCIPKAILASDMEKAKEYASEFKDIFKDDFYLELQDHGLSEEETVLEGILSIADELSIQLVATNDVHYINKSDSKIQKILSDIKMNSDQGDSPFQKSEFYLKSTAEMVSLFGKYSGAVENTVKIAEKCNFDYEFGKTILPEFETPNGEKADEYLKKLARDGLDELVNKELITAQAAAEDYKPRMIYELMIISKMGYSGYYLIVRDFVGYAKGRKIPVGPGRGSGAGSLIAYLVGITSVDPIKHGLLFERFLNPERVSMPDFDIDFCYERRDEVIEYVKNKYGDDKVCQIAAFGTFAARAAVRDVGRALEMQYSEVDRIAKMIPKDLGITIADAMEKNSKLREAYNEEPEVKKLIDLSREIEGMPRHITVHAAGIVISKYPLETLVPLTRSGDVTLTQFDMNTVSDLGLLKFDFLAIRYLTVLSNTERAVKEREPDFSSELIPIDDKETFNMISRGDTSGVFQLESVGMKKLLSSMKPRNIEDIMLAISLFRPGPMESIPKYLEARADSTKITYECEQLRDILSETYGCIVYQEQVMQIFRKLASYSYGRADIVRRLMAKKKAAEMEKERGGFIEGAKRNKIPEDIADSIFNKMASFASYAFCKSHAAAYSYTSYKTAYLKCHYPAEYFAALLSSVSGNSSKNAEYITNAKKQGITVMGPDVNSSGMHFTAKDGKVYYGLSEIKNIGVTFAENVIAERNKQGNYRSFDDFIKRMSAYGINKNQIYSLICSGAFDSLGTYRSKLLSGYELIIERAQSDRRAQIDGQMGLFSDIPEEVSEDYSYPDIPELTARQKLTLEKEMTGMYFSGYWLDDYSNTINNLSLQSVSEMLSMSEEYEKMPEKRVKVKLCGIINRVTPKKTSGGDMMAFVGLEDRYSECELIFFKTAYSKFSSLLSVGTAVSIEGYLSFSDDKPVSVIVDGIELLADNNRVKRNSESRPSSQTEHSKTGESSVKENGNSTVEKNHGKPKILYLKVPSMESREFLRAKALCEIFEGNTPIVFFDAGAKKSYKSSMTVNSYDYVFFCLEKILGEGAVVLK